MPSQFRSATEGMTPSLWHPQKFIFEWKLRGHCTHGGVYMRQVPLTRMAGFRQASLEPGPFGLELSALPTGPPRPCIIRKHFNNCWIIRKIVPVFNYLFWTNYIHNETIIPKFACVLVKREMPKKKKKTVIFMTKK